MSIYIRCQNKLKSIVNEKVHNKAGGYGGKVVGTSFQSAPACGVMVSRNVTMEEFKKFEEINHPDVRHALIDQITGTALTLESLYEALEKIKLIDEVPPEIKSQFNVTKNLAIYTWHSYSLDPVVQLKTYILIEHALKVKFEKNTWPLPKMIKKAINRGWVKDSGFSHVVEDPGDPAKYVREMVEILPGLRNMAAHGSDDLHQKAVGHIQICSEWINQIFSQESEYDKSSKRDAVNSVPS